MSAKKAKLQRIAMLLRIITVATLALFPSLGHAEEDGGEAPLNAFIDRFTKFSKNRNIMTNTFKIDGKKLGAANSRLNGDDGVTFKGDLTYHDFSFNTVENQKEDPNGKKGEAKVDRLFAFVSGHGGLSAAGGSSILERTTYGLHKQFTKADTENNFKKDDEKAGIKFRSVFKISTQEILVDNKDAGGKGDKKESDKVERAELREEALPEITKVGEGSFEDLRRSARDAGNENDDTTLGNGVLLRYAAGEATQALWNSTLANLVQRRVNRGVPQGQFPQAPQLSEQLNTVQKWADTANGAIAKIGKEDTRKALQADVKRMTDQAKQLSALPWNVVNARFEKSKDGKTDELKTGDVQKEDGFVRDLRVQLEVMAKAGKSADDVESNWKYEAKDNKAKIAINFDDGGRSQGEEEMTVKAQLESYNAQLRAAKEGYDEALTRLPGLKVDTSQITDYEIQANSKSMMEINQAPGSALDEVGAKMTGVQAPETYDELQEITKGGGKTRTIGGKGGMDVAYDPSAGVGTAKRPQAIGYDDAAPKR